MASTLRAHGPPPVIRALVDSGSHMCDPYGARALVSASHHANTERLRTVLLRRYKGLAELRGVIHALEYLRP